ncbi:hypothetical protein BJ875DRAFT_459841 [Amylocarpus encephaloides]|uniref:Zn(2)-C6 fungal-type domain-containing protein n=1 Tax=Amylocarpus encephaloides TaxID=45428 RepID=A0A9P7YKF8_9HELO|nr:hypothetical protein BJ875DRAFT_459841 [Amylocarpus encephaloides]
MSSAPQSERQESGEPPRKKIRKGTRSCWECKRRKVKCQLSSEDVPVCAGCLARGTNCLSQEYPEEREPGHNNQVGERLGRVESLLETLLAKISAYEDDEKAQTDILTPESIPANDILTPHDAQIPLGVQDATPFMSLFDHPVLGRRENVPSQAPTPKSQTIASKTPSCKVPRIERIRQTLADLLPSQNDADIISQSSACWLIVHAVSRHTAAIFDDGGESMMSTVFNMSKVAKQHPTTIARTILYLTICLQQVGLEEAAKLNLLPSVELRVERYMSTITALVTSDDELLTSMEGLECLILQGVYHINAGSIRRAWLVFRRALTTAQLLGIHRPNTEVPNGREIWWQIVQGDRYLALILGLPAGAPDDPFLPDETFFNPAVNKDLLFMRTLCVISGCIMDRNQDKSSTAYATTQEIDEKLDHLAKEMPASWWDIPTLDPNVKSAKGSADFDRVFVQLWYYQLEVLLHLPFMLRAATERRYEYSKFSCLKASREIIYRYLATQTEVRTLCCRVIDFSALTATITLLLGGIQASQATETPETRAQEQLDRELVNTVLKLLEQCSRGGKEIIAEQSATVLKSLLAAMDSPSSEHSGNLRLTIPYFGTISIVRPTPVQQPTVAHGCGGPAVMPKSQDIAFDPVRGELTNIPYHNIRQETHQGSNVPIVNFTSNHLPPIMQQDQALQQQQFTDWNFLEADTLFFDSLMSADIDGNWQL